MNAVQNTLLLKCLCSVLLKKLKGFELYFLSQFVYADDVNLLS
jgi:hypothetical protein